VCYEHQICQCLHHVCYEHQICQCLHRWCVLRAPNLSMFAPMMCVTCTKFVNVFFHVLRHKKQSWPYLYTYLYTVFVHAFFAPNMTVSKLPKSCGSPVEVLNAWWQPLAQTIYI
jgi:hypothetical protein